MAIQTVDFSNITRVVKDGSEINAIYINGSQLFLKSDISTDDVNYTWDEYESFAGFLTIDNFGSNHSGDSYWTITEHVTEQSASHIEMSEDLLTMVLIASRFPTSGTAANPPSSYGVVVYTRSSVESVTWDYTFSIGTDTNVGRQAHITSDGGYLALFKYGVTPTYQGQIDVYKWDGATYVAHGGPIDTGASAPNASAFAILDDGGMVVFGSEEGVESRIFFDGQWLVGAPVASLEDWRMLNLKLRQGSRDLPTQPFGCFLMVIEYSEISIFEYTSNGWSQQPLGDIEVFDRRIDSVAWSGDGYTLALNQTNVTNTSGGISVSRRFRIWKYQGGSWVRSNFSYEDGIKTYYDANFPTTQGHVFETDTYCSAGFKNGIASNSVCLNYDGTRMAYIATNDHPKIGPTDYRILTLSVVGYVYENLSWRPHLGQIGGVTQYNKSDSTQSLSSQDELIHNISMSNAGDQIVVSRLSRASYDISLFDAEPKYVLSPISGGLVYEGYTTSILLTTTGVISGTELAYTITGVEAADLQEPLTGIFTVFANTATLQLNVVADNLTEGTQVMTISLDNGQASVDITIADSSTGP